MENIIYNGIDDDIDCSTNSPLIFRKSLKKLSNISNNVFHIR